MYRWYADFRFRRLLAYIHQTWGSVQCIHTQARLYTKFPIASWFGALHGNVDYAALKAYNEGKHDLIHTLTRETYRHGRNAHILCTPNQQLHLPPAHIWTPSTTPIPHSPNPGCAPCSPRGVHFLSNGPSPLMILPSLLLPITKGSYFSPTSHLPCSDTRLPSTLTFLTSWKRPDVDMWSTSWVDLWGHHIFKQLLATDTQALDFQWMSIYWANGIIVSRAKPFWSS